MPRLLTLPLILLTASVLQADEEIAPVRKIWDQGQHNAFTDLIKWEGAYYCTFRESAGHVPRTPEEDGTIRVITSPDGEQWQSALLLTKPGIDLRDPKLSITPDNRLMILMGGSHYDQGKLLGRLPQVAFLSPDGQVSELQPVQIDARVAGPMDWLWRVTWHGKTGYGVIYQAVEGARGLHLLKTTDGVKYGLVKTFDLPGEPNESTVRFHGDTMLLVVRNEDGKARGHLGESSPPYSDWKWADINTRLGGPNLLPLPDGSLILGTRLYGKRTQTAIGTLTRDGKFTPVAVLPSGGDTSYPGLLVEGNELWVSYYSSHKMKTSIYFTKLPVKQFQP